MPKGPASNRQSRNSKTNYNINSTADLMVQIQWANVFVACLSTTSTAIIFIANNYSIDCPEINVTPTWNSIVTSALLAADVLLECDHY